MNSISGANNHKDFSAHTSKEAEGTLEPLPKSVNHTHLQQKVSEFSKHCEKPTLKASDHNKAFISDSEIR